MRRFAVLAGLATVSLLLQTGCLSRAVKESYYGVVGAQGEVYELVRLADYEVDEEPLADYASFALEPITSDLPAEVFTSAQLTLLTSQCRNAVIDSDLFVGGSKKLVGRGRVVHYEGYSFGGTMGAALGSQKALVVRMQLVDGQSNEALGEAALVGVIKSSLRRSDEEFADGVAKALVHWLSKRTGQREEED